MNELERFEARRQRKLKLQPKTRPDYANMTVVELREQAKELGVPYSGMVKADLVRVLHQEYLNEIMVIE